MKKLRKNVEIVLRGTMITAAAGYALMHFGFFYIRGNEMYPAARDGDLCLIEKHTSYNKGDMVIYEADGAMKAGRIVAMEDDTVEIKDGGILLVNDVQPYEEIFYATVCDENAELTYPLTVGQSAVFILNDYRTDTDDSRRLGCISMAKLRGKVIYLLRRRGF